MSCVNGREHNWDLWRAAPEQEREESPWWYRRECQNLGCACVEHAQNLAAVGPTKLFEGWHDSQGKLVVGTFVVPDSKCPPPSHFPPDFSEGGRPPQQAPLPPSVSGARVPGASCNDPSCGETSCDCTHAGCPCYPSPPRACPTCGGEHWLFIEADEEGRPLFQECPDCPAPGPAPEEGSEGQPEGLQGQSSGPR